MFTVIGERINMTRKKIRDGVWNGNIAFIQNEASKQAKAGATHIDINAGGDPSKEVEDMRWLTRVVSEAIELPLVFDSANPLALAEGLKICPRPGTIINSVTGEKKRLTEILPLVKKYKTGVVALTMDDRGIPEDYEGRMRVARELVKVIEAEGISRDRIYLDPLVRPASTNPGQSRFVLEVIKDIRKQFPHIHITLGLSNISFGLPVRNNLNKVFLAMLVAAGCDGAVVDPTEAGMMNTLFSSRAALGLDEYGMDYIKAYRESRLK